MSKRIFALLLALALLLSLCACGKEAEETSTGPAEAGAAETGDSQPEMVPGYISQVIELPEGGESINSMVLEDNKLFVTYIGDNGYKLSSLDLGSGAWSHLSFDSDRYSKSLFEDGVYYMSVDLDVQDGVLWLTSEKYDHESNTTKYYILRYDCATGELLSQAEPGFEAIPGSESPTPIFTYFAALGTDRAALCDFENAYIIDGQARLLETVPLNGFNFQLLLRMGNELYVSGEENGQPGIRSFDMKTYTPGPLVPMESYCSGHYYSESGEGFVLGPAGVSTLDVNTGSLEPLFKLIDVATSLDFTIADQSTIAQSQAGDYYMMGFNADRIQKVSPGLVKEKTAIKLWGDGDLSLTNAVLRFNSTNPDYMIEAVNSGQSGKLSQQELMDMVLNEAPDIVYTPMLPKNSIDAGLFVDLLPYIDADESLSREDFIEPVLESMLQDGGLYELLTRVEILSLAAPASKFPGREEWTVDYVEEMIANRPEGMPVYFWHRDRDYMLNILCRISSGEYVDWDAGTCSFDEGGFARLLQFVKDTPYTSEPVRPVLMEPVTTLDTSQYFARDFLKEDFVYAGFPGTSGNGSYFTDYSDAYSRSGYGIMASSEHKEVAWDFLRLLLLPENLTGMSIGIPVTKAAFEKSLELSIDEDSSQDYLVLTREDAEKMRRLVYSTEKMARQDDTLTEIISTEAAAYFAGDKSLEDTVRNIQSRASIYVAEQAG